VPRYRCRRGFYIDGGFLFHFSGPFAGGTRFFNDFAFTLAATAGLDRFKTAKRRALGTAHLTRAFALGSGFYGRSWFCSITFAGSTLFNAMKVEIFFTAKNGFLEIDVPPYFPIAAALRTTAPALPTAAGRSKQQIENIAKASHAFTESTKAPCTAPCWIESIVSETIIRRSLLFIAQHFEASATSLNLSAHPCHPVDIGMIFFSQFGVTLF
jgi:hypothetical protein